MATPQVSRRSILVAGTGIVGATALSAFAIEPNWLDVTEHEVSVAKLPSDLDGIGIAQITDAHLTRLGMVEEKIIEEIRRRRVQLVVLTGDIVDSDERLGILREFCGELRGSGAKVVATLGNWEHWGKVPADSLFKVYKDVDVRLLVNEGSVVEGIRLYATDDSTGGKANLGGAVPQSGSPPNVLLTHSPELLDRIPSSERRHDLALAGHTHGGQVRLTSRAVPFVPQGSGRFVSGWYETAIGNAYVSRGTGTSILPARFTCRPELPIFRLRQG